MVVQAIEQRVQPGQFICVTLNNGREIRGVLAEIDKDRYSYLIITTDDGEEFIRDSAIEHFRVPRDIALLLPSTSTASPSTSKGVRTEVESIDVPEVSQKSSNSSGEDAGSGHGRPASVSASYSVDVISAAIEIHAQIRTSARQVQLQPISANFEFPEPEFRHLLSAHRTNARNEWVKVQNSYKYAIQIREYSRLTQIAQRLVRFIEIFPSSPRAYFNLGCLYLDASREREAQEAFESAARRFRHRDSYFNLAVIALRRMERGKACYALQEYFRQAAPSENLQGWYKYAELATEHRVVERIGELLLWALKEQRNDDVSLIVDTIVFILKSQGHHDKAHALTLDRLAAVAGDSRILEGILADLSFLSQKPAKTVLDASREIGTIPDVIQTPPITVPTRPSKAQPPKQALEAKKGPNPAVSIGTPDLIEGRRALLAGDLEQAEALLRSALSRGENPEAVVKELAPLLRRRGKTSEGIEILKGYVGKAVNKLAMLNLLADMYQHDGRYPEAIDILRTALKLDTGPGQSNIRKRVAYCCFKLEQFDEAEDLLRQVVKMNPSDATAQRWLDGLTQARRTGFYASLDPLFKVQTMLLEYPSSISKFLQFYLDRCDYEGARDAQVPNRMFSEEDLRKLSGLIEGAGRRRPSVRARYYLTAARLGIDLDSDDESQIRASLQGYAADMGDACLVEQRPFDVVRSFYAEAFSIAPKWTARLSEKLSQFIMLAYATRDEIAGEHTRPVEKCLQEALQSSSGRSRLIEDLLDLSMLNRTVAEVLLPKVERDPALRSQVVALCDAVARANEEANVDSQELTATWARAREVIRQQNQEVINEVSFLISLASGLDSLDDQVTRVRKLSSRMRHGLDRQRLTAIEEVVNHIFDYTQQKSYLERERLATIVKNRSGEILESIEKNPTKFSVELFYPYLYTLRQTIEDHFDSVQRHAEPDHLQIALAVDFTTPDEEGQVECQVVIANLPEKSPASSIVIELIDSSSREYIVHQRRFHVSEALPGGQAVTCPIQLRITEKARQAQVFTLYYHLTYATRRGNSASGVDRTLAVRLHDASDFHPIDNPYAEWVKSTAVTNPRMFYGRGPLIDALYEAINRSNENKSFVIYGQKRAGKSSVLYHLKNRFELPLIPVYFSIGDIISDFSMVTFLYRIIQCVENVLEEMAQRGHERVPTPRPTLAELGSNPQLVFHDYMTGLQRAFRETAGFEGARLILLIDEFTYIYGEIMKQRVPETFMKSWKAMVEKGYFGSVLVGQDVMHQFIARFTNELQVAQSRRVSYLQPEDARQLIVNPVRIPETGESRYRGAAVERLIELTAGSPFYIQIFCNHLVEYMNRKRAPYVTDADIDRVKELLVAGDNRLELTDFDGLITPGDIGTTLLPAEHILKVLRAVAQASRTHAYCERASIVVAPSIDVDAILHDLETREVLEKHGTSLYHIRVGIFKEWLLAHP